MAHLLKLQPLNPGICRVLTSASLHVGNLKLIGGVWKFKAVGYDDAGQVIPGGGPMTEKHNTVIAVADPETVSLALS
jgi:hypothetical protein